MSAQRHGDGPVLFISDLHLTPERPAPAALFHRFIRDIAPHAEALYILGDFFEAWVGDDDLGLPFHAGVAASLKGLADAGVRVYFMAGNRDFLAGPRLAAHAGWTHLADPCVIDLHGHPTLLSHGDAYCTDDPAYQAFRQQVRTAAWQADFLAKPLEERRAMARAIRERSEQAKAGKKPDIMDVNPDAILAAMRQAGVTRLIHGHTHRPARHFLRVDGVECERWVLPDWYESGGYLACDSNGCQARTFP
ncbi:MAG: UDP-2,3-diacylglucosamine diphosphatase [Pseudomonadota bacterium]